MKYQNKTSPSLFPGRMLYEPTKFSFLLHIEPRDWLGERL